MRDVRGNPVSTRKAVALEASERALWRMMSFYGVPFDDLDLAIESDPGWLLPRLMKAGFLLSLTEPAEAAAAHALLDAAEPLIASANHRERDHLVALHTLLAGDWDGACCEWEAILLHHPRDALALQWAHLFDFYRGDAASLRGRVARVLPEWDRADPLFPYVLGLHAFGLEENHIYAEAESVGREALAARAEVPWAIHAVAHVMDMQGRHAEGAAWLHDREAEWTVGNGFVGHLGWHHALFALEALDFDAALARFDAYLKADAEQITLQRIDAASLLWRLQLLGAEVGSRWQALVAGWTIDDDAAGFSSFNDLHVLFALAGSGDLARADAWMRLSTSRAERSAGLNRVVAQKVGVPLMRGVLAYAEGRHADALRLLYPLRVGSNRIGGSHAQRDVIDLTLLAAAAAAHDRPVGRALLNERRLAKPATPLTEHWAERLARPHSARP